MQALDQPKLFDFLTTSYKTPLNPLLPLSPSLDLDHKTFVSVIKQLIFLIYYPQLKPSYTSFFYWWYIIFIDGNINRIKWVILFMRFSINNPSVKLLLTDSPMSTDHKSLMRVFSTDNFRPWAVKKIDHANDYKYIHQQKITLVNLKNMKVIIDLPHPL